MNVLQPGLVVKATTTFKPKQKVFINVCSCELIEIPKSNSGAVVPLEEHTPQHGFGNMTVPFDVLQPARGTRDNNGNVAHVVDVVVNPVVVKCCREHGDNAGRMATQHIIQLACDWVQQETDFVLDVKAAHRIKAACKGGLPKLRPNNEPDADGPIKLTTTQNDETQRKGPLIQVLDEEEENAQSEARSNTNRSTGGGDSASNSKHNKTKGATSGLQKGFLLNKDISLYGPEGSNEGTLPENAGDPLGWMPEKLRKSARIIDPTKPQQQQQQQQAKPPTSQAPEKEADPLSNFAANLPDELKNIDVSKINAKDFMKDMEKLGSLGGLFDSPMANLFQQMSSSTPSNLQPASASKPSNSSTPSSHPSNSSTQNLHQTNSSTLSSQPLSSSQPSNCATPSPLGSSTLELVEAKPCSGSPPTETPSDPNTTQRQPDNKCPDSENTDEPAATTTPTPEKAATSEEDDTEEGEYPGDDKQLDASSVRPKWSVVLPRRDVDHPKGPNVYVNVCQSADLAEMDPYNPTHNSGYIPTYVSWMEENCIDIVVHPNVLTKCNDDLGFQEDFITEICSLVQQKHREKIRPIYGRTKRSGPLLSVCKGEVRVELEQQQRAAARVQVSVQNRMHAGQIVVTALLPCATAKGVDVVLENNSVSISPPDCPPAFVELPCPVQQDEYKAKFVKKNKTLTLTFFTV